MRIGSMIAQQVAAQNQLQQLRPRGLPAGGEMPPEVQPGTYL